MAFPSFYSLKQIHHNTLNQVFLKRLMWDEKYLCFRLRLVEGWHQQLNNVFIETRFIKSMDLKERNT